MHNFIFQENGIYFLYSQYVPKKGLGGEGRMWGKKKKSKKAILSAQFFFKFKTLKETKELFAHRQIFDGG